MIRPEIIAIRMIITCHFDVFNRSLFAAVFFRGRVYFTRVTSGPRSRPVAGDFARRRAGNEEKSEEKETGEKKKKIK